MKNVIDLKEDQEKRTCSNCNQEKDCTIKKYNHGESCQMHNYEGE